MYACTLLLLVFFIWWWKGVYQWVTMCTGEGGTAGGTRVLCLVLCISCINIRNCISPSSLCPCLKNRPYKLYRPDSSWNTQVLKMHLTHLQYCNHGNFHGVNFLCIIFLWQNFRGRILEVAQKCIVWYSSLAFTYLCKAVLMLLNLSGMDYLL